MTVSDVNPDRLARAEAWGPARVVDGRDADSAMKAIEAGAPYDYIIDGSGIPELPAWIWEYHLLAHHGCVGLLAVRTGTTFHWSMLHGTEGSIEVSCHFTLDDLRVLIHLAREGLVRIEPMISHRVSIDDALGIYNTMRDTPGALAGVVFDWSEQKEGPMEKSLRVFAGTLVLALVSGCASTGTPPQSPLTNAMMLKDCRTLRSSTFDREGGNMDMRVVQPGETLSWLDVDGPGCVRHMYFTYIVGDKDTRQQLFRNFILRMYWDGESAPSVEVPLGDFFGVCGGLPRPLASLVLTTNPGTGAEDISWGFNSYFTMPFAAGACIEVTNEGSTAAGLWVHVDYERYERPPAWLRTAGRFHACFHRSNPAAPVDSTGRNLTGDKNYVILDVEGRGALAGYVLTVDNVHGGWWGEGDDMVFVDGDTWPPSYHGTGTEEIFGGGACPNVEYSGPYTGFHLVENAYGDPWYGKNGMYRFFVNDPIRFRDAIRVTIEHGHANDLANDYSSVAYWYQAEPHQPFPALPLACERLPLGPPPPLPTVEGALEGEALVTDADSSGDHLAAIRYAGDFSGRQFLWFVPDAEGDYFSVPFSVPETGTYALSLYLVAASDFGIVQPEIDGHALGVPIDNYNGEGGIGHTHVIATGEIKCPARLLAAGEHRLAMRVAGKRPEAHGHMVGLDCLVLRRVPEGR